MSAELKLCVHELSNHTQKFDSFNSILQLEKLEGKRLDMIGVLNQLH